MNKGFNILGCFISWIILFFLNGCYADKQLHATKNKMIQPITVFPFQELSGGIIVVKATIDNYPDSLNFIFDTGNTGFSIDSVTADQLGLKMVTSSRFIKGIAGIKKAIFTYDHAIHFPGFTPSNFDLHVSDYTIFEEVYGLKINGIVGFSFFQQYIVKIDYDKHLIECFLPGAINYPKAGQFLPTTLYKYPVNTVELKEQSFVQSNSIFDLGAGLNYLVSTRLVNETNLFYPKKKLYPIQVEGLGGKKVIDMTIVKKLKIGSYRFKNVPIHVFEDEYNILNYPNLGGLIGSDLLRRFNLILNYPEDKIHILPNGHFYDRFDYHYSGISFYTIDGSVSIVDIVPGSPGDLFGFKVDDIIFSIDKKIVINSQTIKDHFELNQPKHIIGIIRAHQLLELPIRLRNIKKQN